MTFKARLLEGLTLDAVKAKSLAQHLRLGETNTHFNPEVSTAQRLAVLGEYVGASFKYGALDIDVPRLQDALLELAAYAATWAELLDTHQSSLNLSGVVR
jgi:hypothetical protein